MDRPRIGFLPLFFAFLIAAFVVAAALRIRSYSQAESAGAAHPSADSDVKSAPERQPQSAASADADGPTSTSSAEPSATATQLEHEREQRYNQLLSQPMPSAAAAANRNTAAAAAAAKSSPPAPPPPPKSAPKPSLLSRIVAPIVNAMGGGSKPPEAASAPAKDNQPKEPKDPSSDTTPPQLQSLEFNPPSVKDGEATVLVIMATDDLSGVSSIAGNVISPSGALQGFALQPEGAPNRYATRIMIPKNAAEGVWHVNYLSLTDKASNTTSLSYSQGNLPGSASFRVVSSNADSTPPTLRALWLDRVSMKAGEKNTVFVQADDDKSGVNLISGVFISPSHYARVGFGCRLADGGDTWSCDFVPPTNSDCGDWQLEQLQLQDKANNMIAVRRDNPILAAVHLNVMSDSCDSHPPTVEAIVLDRYSTARPGTVVVRISASDDISGVSSVSGHFVYTGQFSGTQPPKLWFACSPTDPQTWSGPVAVGETQAVGVWRLEQLQVLDKANNLKIYTMADPVVANVSFRIQ